MLIGRGLLVYLFNQVINCLSAKSIIPSLLRINIIPLTHGWIISTAHVVKSKNMQSLHDFDFFVLLIPITY